MILGGWGRYPRVDCPVAKMRNAEDARAAVEAGRSVIARGNGRAYGDAALNRTRVLSMLPCDHIAGFDAATGRITCEAGLLLADLIAFALPRGFFPPVSPGTKFVTIGGMIAADVHGKNHHRYGTFGRHVESLTLLTADGAVCRCSRDAKPDLFAATLGGMGLTGVILNATFRLMPVESGAIRQEILRAAHLEETMAFSEASETTYAVAWIDCLARGRGAGRGLVYRSDHATAAEAARFRARTRRERRLPFDLPDWALNAWSVRAFNTLYYRCHKPGTAIVALDSHFYPLDAVLDWNRAYGKRGLSQYQCVLPQASSRAALALLMDRVAQSGRGSPLAVLKLFGPEGEGLLSFPMKGYTVTFDFPVDAATLALMVELDAIVADHGGRLYLAKDARTGAAMMRKGYRHLDRFLELREAVDPGRKFASLQSERLGL